VIKCTQLVHLADRGALEEIRGVIERVTTASPMLRTALCQPTLPGSFNGGDLIVHLQFDDAAALQACVAQTQWRTQVEPLLADRARVAHIDSALYDAGRSGTRAAQLSAGIYRVAFFAVEPQAAPPSIAQYEADLLLMPMHLPRMLNWSLSRISRGVGTRAWTHVWEQEYATLDALTVDYMVHPVHWGYVDRWFDPECPERIVDLTLCHGFCELPRSVIAAPPS